MNGDPNLADVPPSPDSGKYERLLGAVQSGDREAEQAVALEFMRPVRAMLLARLRNPDAAPDLLQDVMIEVLASLRRGQVREPAKLPAFVAGVCRNLLNQHFRKSQRQMESLEFPDDLPDTKRAATDSCDDPERESLALNAINSLDPVDRQILQLTLVDGLKPGVIAEKLRLNPDVVRQRKLRATRRVIHLVKGMSQTAGNLHLITRGER